MLKCPNNVSFYSFSPLPFNSRRLYGLLYCQVTFVPSFFELTYNNLLTHAGVLELAIRKFEVGHLLAVSRDLTKFSNKSRYFEEST